MPHDGKRCQKCFWQGLFGETFSVTRFWLVLVLVIFVQGESWVTPARADGGEALLERLLDDSAVPAAAVVQQTSKTTTTTTTTNAARVTPRDALRLTPDRTEIIRLDRDAASVVVTNPAHAQVMMETPRLLLVMPRAPGSTSLFVLDQDGQTILERDIIVSAAAAPYVRIRKSCTGADEGCNANSYYYCPDGCYEVSTVPSEENTALPEISGETPILDAAPVAGTIPPNAQSRSEPAPLPPLEGEAGLATDNELDTPVP